MRPEMPYLAAGAIAIGGGFVREHAWPKEGTGALIGTIAMVLVASATSGSAFAPLVRAFGFLVLLAAVFSAVPVFQANRAKKG